MQSDLPPLDLKKALASLNEIRQKWCEHEWRGRLTGLNGELWPDGMAVMTAHYVCALCGAERDGIVSQVGTAAILADLGISVNK